MTIDDDKFQELLSELQGIRRAIEELGFNGAVTRLDASTQGIGERLVLALERIAMNSSRGNE